MDPMNYGQAGMIARHGEAKVESCTVDDTPPERYGDAVSLNASGTITKVSATCPVMIYGVLSGSYPRLNVKPEAKRTEGVVREGKITVQVGAGDPYKGCPAFVRVQNGTSAKPIGGWEAEADGTNSVKAANAVFDTAMDANGVAVLEFGVTSAQ